VTGAAGAPSARNGFARRLFFASWPDDAARCRLAAAVRDLVPEGAGRPQRPDQWHMTIEFLGDVPGSRLQDVLDAGMAASGGATACGLEFDRVEHWRRPQVLCLAASSIPGPLAGLLQALRAALRQRGFTPDTRPFRPHLTLARRCVQAPPAVPFEPLQWPVQAISLVQSVTGPAGARYVELSAWPTGIATDRRAGSRHEPATGENAGRKD
jgi:2'-5' RNA ligase